MSHAVAGAKSGRIDSELPSRPRLRIGLLTNEFLSGDGPVGGLGTYLVRTARVLADLGHEVEVLCISLDGDPRSFELHGFRVEPVPMAERRWLHAAWRLSRLHPRLELRNTVFRLQQSIALAEAFAEREREAPFDFVQTTNCGLSGLFVRRRPGRPHLLRMSSNQRLWQRAQRRPRGLDTWMCHALERRCLRRADAVYAPSRLVADSLLATHGRRGEVLRPPAFLEVEPEKPAGPGSRSRYLLHFGRLGWLKGSDILARALPLAWAEAPDLAMVWAGDLDDARHTGFDLEHCRALWGERADQVEILGPVEKAPLYALIEGATASVVPSRVDNLPNAAIESLTLGTPVIGSAHSSVDELVEDGRSGAIVPGDDPAALAAALVRAWRGEPPFDGRSFSRPASLEALEPRTAAENLLLLAVREGAMR